MSNPVDIKIARINKSENVGTSINKDKVHEVFQRNINDKLKSFYRLQQDWVNRAYKNFNDLILTKSFGYNLLKGNNPEFKVEGNPNFIEKQ